MYAYDFFIYHLHIVLILLGSIITQVKYENKEEEKKDIFYKMTCLDIKKNTKIQVTFSFLHLAQLLLCMLC